MKIGVVIPTFDKPIDALECVRSVLSSELEPTWTIEVVVVDNSSGEEVVRALRDLPVRVVRPGLNLGVAGGRNRGLGHLEGCEVVVFVDHDVQLEPECLRKLVDALADQEGVGIGTPRVMYLDAPDRTWAAGTTINLRTGRVGFITDPPSDEPFEVDVAPSVIAVKRSVLRSIGGFDERYFATLEDTDFCIRARKHGFRTLCVPSAKAFHRTPIEKRAQYQHLLSRAYWVGRNRTLFIRSHGTNRAAYLLMLPAYFAYYAYLPLRLASPKGFVDFVRGTAAGGFDGLLAGNWLRLIPFTFLRRINKMLPHTGLLLDAGCGDGELMAMVNGFGSERRIIGVEIDIAKLKRARSRGVYMATVRASIDNLPFRTDVFDGVLSAEVIEHLPKERGSAVLSELNRVAKGRIVVTTPNGAGQEPSEATANPYQVHRSEWSPEDLMLNGYRVYGLGLKWAWGPGGQARKRGTRGYLARLLSFLGGPIASRLPARAAGLLAIKSKAESKPSDDWAHTARKPEDEPKRHPKEINSTHESL